MIYMAIYKISFLVVGYHSTKVYTDRLSITKKENANEDVMYYLIFFEEKRSNQIINLQNGL